MRSGVKVPARRQGIKLHRCYTNWKAGPCWRVQKALDEQGTAYEVVKGRRVRANAELQRLSGQTLYPVIEFENGSIYRDESNDLAATIRARKLDEEGLAKYGAAYAGFEKRRVTNAPTALSAPTARPIRFVCTQVRQALQKTAAVGAFSPYFAVA